MTLDELFPREQFPLRAKTKVLCPEIDSIMEVSYFYQYPFGGIDQNFGIKFSLFVDGEKLLSAAVRNFAEIGGDKRYIQGEDGRFSPASEEDEK